MKTKAKSTHVFELRLWSKKHYGGSNYRVGRRDNLNIYDGFVIDAKTKKRKYIDSAGDLLRAIELMYFDDEKNEK